ncbi:MAG: hypothetical protein Q9169_006451 [Polycauliona sp. 2 TL-2023]
MANVTKDVDRRDPVLTRIRENPLNLTNPGDVDVGNYYSALTLGLPYLAYQRDQDSTRRIGKSVGTEQPTISPDVYTLAYNFAKIGLISSPAMIDVMWPIDGSTTSNSDDVFDAGVANLFTNLQRFVAFTSLGVFTPNITDSNGNYTVVPDVGVLSQNTGLSLAASTLHTTTRLLQNGFIIVPDPNLLNDSSKLTLAGRIPTGCIFAQRLVDNTLFPSESPCDDTTGTSCTELIDDDHNYGSICDALDGSPAGARYWSSSTQRIYNFGVNITSPEGIATLNSGKTNAKQVLLDIWTEGYADLNLMFDGGYECQSNGYFGALLRVSSSGQMDFNCFSSVPMDIRGVRKPGVSYVKLANTQRNPIKFNIG